MGGQVQLANIPLIGHGGEQNAAGYAGGFTPSQVRRLVNGIIVAPGTIYQKPDWLLAETLTDGAVELEGGCGVFPFATQGDASDASAGVAFGFSLDADTVYLFQLDENHNILRQFLIEDTWTAAVPPQITGFEMEYKFFFTLYGQEAASSRKGMGYFDPAGTLAIVSSNSADPVNIQVTAHGLETGDRIVIAGSDAGIYDGLHTITKVDANNFTINIGGPGDSSTNGAIYVVYPEFAFDGGSRSTLRFRGIAKHRGGTILGWGYRHENDPDRGAFLRWCRYTEPLTWAADATGVSAGFTIIGTPGLEIVAAGPSGRATIIGKETEIYAFEGDYSEEFGADLIGSAHGPVSTTGLASGSDFAAWMSNEGPAVSVHGSKPELLSTNRLVRRLSNWIDLRKCWAVYDSVNERVLWLLRRTADDDGNPLALPYADQVLIWDHRRDALYVENLPTMCFAIGVTKGPALAQPGPTGTLTFGPASGITQSEFTINFTPDDTSPGVTYEFQARVNGTTEWEPIGGEPSGATTHRVAGRVANTEYDVRGRQVRNGQVSAFVEELSYATTLAEPDGTGNLPPAPANVRVLGQTNDLANLRATVEVGWTPNFTPNLKANLYFNTANNFSTATLVRQTLARYGAALDNAPRSHGSVVYYWVAFQNTDGVGPHTASANNPFTIVVTEEL